jgi:hypothetical protein
MWAVVLVGLSLPVAREAWPVEPLEQLVWQVAAQD